jgi:dethiobiotin synthetase
MPTPKRLYVAAASQHVGKTTTTLGLLATLRSHGLDVGYCKPLGQQYVDYCGSRVDKDATLFASFLDFELQPQHHSPVIMGPGLVANYLDSPDGFDLSAQVEAAAQWLEERHDLVVYEGTGHPGVGSTLDLSNADVAQLLDASVVLVVEAGIGRTLDQLALTLALFAARKVPIAGVIVNKAKPSKIDKVTHYVGRYLAQRGIPLLGVIPYEAELALPMVHAVNRAVGGEVWLHPDQLHRPVRGILSSSSLEQANLNKPQQWLLVVSDRRAARTLARLRCLSATNGIDRSPLVGMVVAGAEPCLTREDLDYLSRYQIPVLITPLDTYEIVMAYGNIEVKMNAHTPWKMQRAVELFQQHSQVLQVLDNSPYRVA